MEENNVPAGQAKEDKIIEFFLMDEAKCNEFVKRLAARVQDGFLSPIKTAVGLKCMQDICSCFMDSDKKNNPVFHEMAKGFKSAMLAEAETFGEKKFTHLGHEMRIGEVGTKFSFEMCGDPLLPTLETTSKAAAEELKKRKEFLKTLPAKGQEILVDDEAVMVYPPSKTSTTALIISLK